MPLLTELEPFRCPVSTKMPALTGFHFSKRQPHNFCGFSPATVRNISSSAF
jgi:hypothetical protein